MSQLENITIRPAATSDATVISNIYNHYVRHTVITFEEEDVTPEVMAQRIDRIRGDYPFLIAEDAGQVIGYAYATQWKARASYRYTVETSIYLDHEWTGRKLGQLLYEELISQLIQRGFKSAIGGVSLPNDASVHFHERFGFEYVGRFKDVGIKFGKPVDVGYWQLDLTLENHQA